MRKGRCSFEKFKVAVGGTFKWNHAGEKWRYDANAETVIRASEKDLKVKSTEVLTEEWMRKGRIGQGRHQC